MEGIVGHRMIRALVGAFHTSPTQRGANIYVGPLLLRGVNLRPKKRYACNERNRRKLRLPSFSGHPISADLVSVREDVHCESTTPEIHT